MSEDCDIANAIALPILRENSLTRCHALLEKKHSWRKTEAEEMAIRELGRIASRPKTSAAATRARNIPIFPKIARIYVTTRPEATFRCWLATYRSIGRTRHATRYAYGNGKHFWIRATRIMKRRRENWSVALCCILCFVELSQ